MEKVTMENKRKEKANKEKQEMEEQEGKGKKGKKEGKQETTRNNRKETGNIRKQQERERNQVETRGNEFCSSHFCSNGTLLERVAEDDFVVCCPFAPSEAGSWSARVAQCRGRFAQGIMEADFDGSSSVVDDVASSTACSSTK